MYLLSKQNLGSTLKYSSKNIVLASYFNDFATRRIPVPVLVQGGVFLLDFEESLRDAIDAQKTISSDKFRNLLALIVKTYDKLDAIEMARILKEYGIKLPKDSKAGASDEDSIESFVSEIKTRIARQLAESGLSGALVSTFFTEDAEKISFKEFGAINLSNIGSVVDNVQNFYSQFKQHATGDSLADTLNSMCTTNPILQATSSLLRTFYSSQGSYVQARENYVMDKMFQSAFGEPLVSKTSLLDGRFYQIDEVNFPEISYADALTVFLWSMNTSMGVDTAFDENKKGLPISDILTELVTGIGVIMPFLPEQAGKPDFGRIEEHYKRVFLMHLIRRITSDLPGDFHGRVINSIKTNKYFKLEEYEKEFMHSLRTLSMVYESYRDTAAYYRALYRNEDVVFADFDQLHHLRRRKITEFVESLIERFSTSSQTVDHPAYYKLPTHVTMNTASTLSFTPMAPDWAVSRNSLSTIRHDRVLDVRDFTNVMRFGCFTAGLHPTSSWFSIAPKLDAMGLPYPLINEAKTLHPMYYFTTPSDDALLGSEALRAMLRAIPEREIKRIEKINDIVADQIASKSSRFRVHDVYEFSMRLEIPTEMAEAILRKRKSSADDYWYDLSDITDVTYFMAPHVAPILEFVNMDEEGNYKFVPPFVATFPALVTSSTDTFNMFKQRALTGLEDELELMKKKKEKKVTPKKEEEGPSTPPANTEDEITE